MTETMKERLSSVTRTFDGCEFVHLYSDPDEANHLFLLERWESRDKYEKHREWAMAQAGSSEAMSLLERAPAGHTWTTQARRTSLIRLSRAASGSGI